MASQSSKQTREDSLAILKIHSSNHRNVRVSSYLYLNNFSVRDTTRYIFAAQKNNDSMMMS